MNISVTAPLEQALRRAKLITFQPFDVSKWFALGFTAWLATLGEGGMGFNFNFLEQFGPEYSIFIELLQPPDAPRF